MHNELDISYPNKQMYLKTKISILLIKMFSVKKNIKLP
jgi:hypothetical protein